MCFLIKTIKFLCQVSTFYTEIIDIKLKYFMIFFCNNTYYLCVVLKSI